MKKKVIVSLILGMVILPAIANAQTAGTPAPGGTPAGVITDRFTAQPLTVGLDASYFKFRDNSNDYALHLDIHGQRLRDVGTGLLGGYFNLPLSYMEWGGENLLSLGNIELGVLSVFGSRTAHVIFRGGLSMETAHGLNEWGRLGAYWSSWGRINDMFTQYPDSNWIRLGATPVYRGDRFFVRGDIGLDFLIPKGDELEVDPLVRLNVAAGVDLKKVIVMAELATIHENDDVYDPGDWLQSVALTVQGTGSVAPFGGVVVHLREAMRDTMMLVVTAGVRMNVLNVAD